MCPSFRVTQDDLHSTRGRAALLRDADVLVHGYRPGALDGLGLDAATRHELAPDQAAVLEVRGDLEAAHVLMPKRERHRIHRAAWLTPPSHEARPRPGCRTPRGPSR